MVRKRRRRVAIGLVTSTVLAGCSTGSSDAASEACRLVTRAQESVSSAAQQPEELRNLSTLSRQLDAAHRAVENLSSRGRERLVHNCNTVSTIIEGTNRAAAFSAIAANLLRAEAQLAVMMEERSDAGRRASEEERIAIEIARACEAIVNARSSHGDDAALLIAALRDAEHWIQSAWSDDARSKFFQQCAEVKVNEVAAELEELTGRLTEIVEQQQAERERLIQERVEQELRRGLDTLERWWRETHWAAQNVMCQGFDELPIRDSERWSSVVNGGTTLSGTSGDVRPEHVFVFLTEACNDYMRSYCNHTRSCSGLIDWNARR